MMAKKPSEPTQPEKYDVEKDVRKFTDLRDRLNANWVQESDKAAIRQMFRQLANEV